MSPGGFCRRLAEDAAILGKLYVHVSDVRHFLLVRRDTGFPYAQFDRSKWRVIAVGVEPMTALAVSSLRKNGYHEYREPLTN